MTKPKRKGGWPLGKPRIEIIDLSDNSLIAIAIYFLRQVKDRNASNPAITYLTSLQDMNTR